MDKLPAEVLCRIADLIVDEPMMHARRPTATVTLYNLIRTSKAYYQALRFKLYQDVHLATREQATSWLACYTELVEKSGVSNVKDKCIARYGILNFYYRTREFFLVLGEEEDEDACSRVADLKPALHAGLLAHLQSFEINECFIDPHSDNPGLIIPPELQGLKCRPKRYRSTFKARCDEKWLPLTTRELQEYPFQPYLLDLLDLELMSFKVIKPVSA